MTQAKLQLLCKKWQRRLRLQDFDISVRFGSALEMSNGDIGRNRMRWRLGLSDIVILSPEENDSNHSSFHNIELTLVHELLHLMLDPILSSAAYDSDRLEYALMEQTIEKLAKGLLEI